MTVGIGRVIQSRNSKFSKDDLVVSNFFPFSEYSIVSPTSTFLRVIDQTAGIEIPVYLSTLGKHRDFGIPCYREKVG